jgi:cysteine-rich repeat protein
VEECDDGNAFNEDGCIGCRLARCGDGISRTSGDPAQVEECDDGDDDDLDGCASTCRLTRWEVEPVAGAGAGALCARKANGDGGPAVGTPLSQPGPVAVLPDGRVVFSSYDTVVADWSLRTVDAAGRLATLTPLGQRCVSLAVDDQTLLAAWGSVVEGIDVATGARLGRVVGNGAEGHVVPGPATGTPLPPVVQVTGSLRDGLYVLVASGGVSPERPQVWKVQSGQVSAVPASANAGGLVTGIAADGAGSLRAMVLDGTTAQTRVWSTGPVTLGTPFDVGAHGVGQLVREGGGRLLTTVGASVVEAWTGAVLLGRAEGAGAFPGHECPSARYREEDVLGARLNLAAGPAGTVVSDHDNGVLLAHAPGGCWRRLAGAFAAGVPPPRDARCVVFSNLQEVALSHDAAGAELPRLVLFDDDGLHALDLHDLTLTTLFPRESAVPNLACPPSGPPPTYTYTRGEGLPATRSGVVGLVSVGDQWFYLSVAHNVMYRVTGWDWRQDLVVHRYQYADNVCCNPGGGPRGPASMSWQPPGCVACEDVTRSPVPRTTVVTPGGQVLVVASDLNTCKMYHVSDALRCEDYLTQGTPPPTADYMMDPCSGPTAVFHQPASHMARYRARHASYGVMLGDTNFHRIFTMEMTDNGEFASGGMLAGQSQRPGRVAGPLPVTADEAVINAPTGSGEDAHGNHFFAETGNAWVRQVDRHRMLRVVAEIPGLQTLVVHPTLGTFARTADTLYVVRPVF